MTPDTAGRLTARLLAGSWRAAPHTPGSPPLPEPPVTPEELSALTSILLGNGSGGLAWARIRNSSLRDRPGSELLKDAYRVQTLRARAMETRLGSVLAFLRERGVEPVLGKGWSVSRLYPEAGLRPYGDHDLLVLPSQLPAARNAFLEPGRPVVAVELHDHFRQLEDRTPEALVARARTELLDGVEVQVLAPEDHLRLLTLHGLCHGLWRPIWLCDVALFLDWISRDPGSFDWELCTRGDRWRSEGVRCGLGLARDLLGADLEAAGVPGDWQDPPLPTWLVPATLRSWGTAKHYVHVRGPRDLLGEPLKLLEAARLKWATPMEVTYRREAPWNDTPRFRYQLMDYLTRGFALLRDVPGELGRRRGN